MIPGQKLLLAVTHEEWVSEQVILAIERFLNHGLKSVVCRKEDGIEDMIAGKKDEVFATGSTFVQVVKSGSSRLHQKDRVGNAAKVVHGLLIDDCVPSKTFLLFSQLPLELQRGVWQYAVGTSFYTGKVRTALIAENIYIRVPLSMPLLHVCSEARHETLLQLSQRPTNWAMCKPMIIEPVGTYNVPVKRIKFRSYKLPAASGKWKKSGGGGLSGTLGVDCW